MEQRTFTPPDVRTDSEIEFCTPSWKRNKKYVSWGHWFTTKTVSGKRQKDLKTSRFKLFEIAHYAGSVILEIGLERQSNSAVAIKSALEAGWDVQYFAVEKDVEAIDRIHQKFIRKRVDKSAVFFKGTLSEFRNLIPVVPTMVVVNWRENVENVLSHLSLFLRDGTPVLIQNWFQSRAEFSSFPSSNSFESCGRFGDSILLKTNNGNSDSAIGLSESDFQQVRNNFCVGEEGLIQNRKLRVRIESSSNRCRSDKKWPFKKDTTQYPATLPDGTPWPKISIVTPTRNQGNFIEETINSVINQNYPNLEYIVVDGDSTDETPLILDRYRESFKHLISEPDEGQSDAINKGMALATGDILTWLNSDDLLTPGALFAMAMAFWKSGSDMVVGTVQFLKDGEIVGEHLTSCPSGPLHLSELLDLENNWLKGRFFYQPELMFTRDLWERAGGKVDNELYFSMDHELWLRFAIAGANMHVIGRPTVMYRVHDQQKTHADFQPELRRVNQRYIEKLGLPETVKSPLLPKKYSVAMVNDVGARYGAGIAHSRLRDSLVAAGHEVAMICAKETEQSQPKSATEIYLEIENVNPDLVLFGNLHNAGLDMSIVDQASERWPTCFVMHDLWLATGRCIYLGGCEKYKSNCDSSCPTSPEYPALNPEQIESAFDNKLNVISKPRKVVVMANSEWSKNVAEASAITSKSVLKTLKYGFPTHVFKRRDQSVCREVLGLPQNAFIVLFSSVDVSEERKGLRHLFEALNRLQLENLVPVCVGFASDPSELYPGTISLGYVEDPYRSAMIYSAADVFVGPSLQEAFGQVFVEAAACGTPSIGYPVGGVQEAIVHGVTGLVAESANPTSLAEEIAKLYFDEEYRQKLSVWGRLEVENHWSIRSSYHHFNNLLREVPEHIGFLPPDRIFFDPAKTAGVVAGKSQSFGILDKVESCVSAGVGFADEERLQLLDGTISTGRWCVGSVANLNVRIVGNDKRKLIGRCLNPALNQVVKVYCDGKLMQTIDVETREKFLSPIEICLMPDLAPGEYQIRLEFSSTVKEQNGMRDMAMMFLDIELLDHSANRNKESKPA